MPIPILTADHTWLRLNQDEYFQPFFRDYLEILKSQLKQIPDKDHREPQLAEQLYDFHNLEKLL